MQVKENTQGAGSVGSKAPKKGGWYYRLAFQKRTALWGIIFMSPWILGFLLFFIRPMIEVFIYSVNEVKLGTETGLAMKYVGLANYKEALLVDPEFVRKLTETVVQTLPSVFLIIIFSLISAVLLNGNYFGRMAARAIFFIPIIMAAGLMTATVGGTAAETVKSAQQESLLGANFLANFLLNSGMPKQILGSLTKAVSSIFSVITMSGVQTLIFLAGLQSIAPQLYEVAKIEGATGYETFWKVTFPLVSPMILTCSIYSLADAFLRSDITTRIYDIAFKQSRYGLSASMSCIYLIVTLVIMVVINFLISRKVFYYD